MKVLITGGAGFIGSHLAEYWLDRNARVIVLDNLRTGYRKNIPDTHNVEFVEGSITNRDLVFGLMENTDYVFHLAAMVSVPESVEKPFECIDVNVYGLLNVLDAAKNSNVKKVVLSSSAAIYGDDPELPKSVNMKPKPLSPYGITKLDGEYYLQMYFNQYSLGTTSLRYFNVFGPRQDPKSQYAAAIPIFIYKALRNENILIYGDGEQTRDFIYVKDVVSANIAAAENEEITGVFNVANGKSITINKLAEKIIKLTNSKSKIEYTKERLGDIKHSVASVKETKENLGFVPSHNFDDSLLETIKYFEKEAK